MISIILATKNGEKYIKRAIDSVLNQTEKDFELIIINDTSTDRTLEIINEYAKSDSRLSIINLRENIGPGLARAKGIESAKGEFIAIIDDDDYWISKDKLQRQKDFLEKNKDYCLVGSNKIKLVDENSRFIRNYHNPISDSIIRKVILIRNCFSNSTVMFKKDTYTKVGGFKNMFLAEDYDLWLRLGKIGKFCNMRNIEVAYTVRKSSLSHSRKIELYKTNIRLIKEYRKYYSFGYIGILKNYFKTLLI